MNAQVLVAVAAVILTVGSLAEGYRFKPTCLEYKRAYIQLKAAIGTCQNINNYGCRVNSFMEPCDFRCIPMSQRCDGAVQCPLGDDEMNCPPDNSTPVPPSSSTRVTTLTPDIDTSTTPLPTTTTLPVVVTEPCCAITTTTTSPPPTTTTTPIIVVTEPDCIATNSCTGR